VWIYIICSGYFSKLLAMKYALFLWVVVLSCPAFSQQRPKADSIATRYKAKLDSLAASKWQDRLDSLEGLTRFSGIRDSSTVLRKSDSLKTKWRNVTDAIQGKLIDKIDSIKSLASLERWKDSLKVVSWADTMRYKVNNAVAKSSQKIKSKMDSLTNLQLPTGKYQKKADSVLRKQKTLLREVGEKKDQLQQKINTRYQKWGSKIDSLGVKTPNANVQSLTNKLNTPATNLPNLPNASVPNASIPTTQVSNIPNIPSLNTKDFAGLDLSKDLSNVGGKIAIPATDQFKQWNDQLKNISTPLGDVKGKISEAKGILKDPTTAAEGAAKQLKEVNSLTNDVSSAEKLIKENEALKMAEQMKDPQKLKEEAAKRAVDHFAGKEEILKQAIDQMAKIKQKVPSLERLDKLPKNYKWRNGLKGKPFRERVRFGLNVGINARKDSLIVDFFPNIAYNLSGSIEMGLGGIYRVRESTKTWQFDQANPVWGFIGFGVFKVYKSVRFRVESDVTSYTKIKGASELVERQWRWVWFAGVQTSLKISQRMTGNIQLLYNFDKSLTAGFPEQLTLRMGVQYRLANRKSKKK